jgi:hypothetical protein
VDSFDGPEDEAPLIWSPTTKFPPTTAGERVPGLECSAVSGKGGSGHPNHRVRELFRIGIVPMTPLTAIHLNRVEIC